METVAYVLCVWGVFIPFIVLLVVYFRYDAKKRKISSDFIENSKKIQMGMSFDEVVLLMGDPTSKKVFQDGSFECVYERSEWRGMLHGGTQVRRVEVVFSPDNQVTAFSRNQNCDMSPGY